VAEEAAQAAAQANWDVEFDTEATTEENGACSDAVPSFGSSFADVNGLVGQWNGRQTG
jgi:hypothetical protein